MVNAIMVALKRKLLQLCPVIETSMFITYKITGRQAYLRNMNEKFKVCPFASNNFWAAQLSQY
jgi:hypothetical protein